MKTYYRPARVKRGAKRGFKPQLGLVRVGKLVRVNTKGEPARTMQACMVVKVRSGNAYWRNRFRWLCNNLNLNWERADDLPKAACDTPQQARDVFSTFRIWGLDNDVRAALASEEVVHWEYQVHAPQEPPVGKAGFVSRPKGKPAKATKPNAFYGLDKQLLGHRERYQQALDNACLPK